MNKILVVGGAGYVGSYLTSYLAGFDHNVTVYDNLVYANHFLKKVPFIFGDVRDREKLSEILPEYNTVVWLAAVVGDGACAIDPYLTRSINEDAIKWLVDHYHGKVIFTSTCSVYGINNKLIDESALLNPISVYAKTKLAAEKYIASCAKDFLIFRLGTLFGLGDEHSRIRLDLVVNYLAMKAARGESLAIYGGDQWRPLLHVKDVAGAVCFSLGRGISGLYNLSCGNFRIREIAQAIQDVLPGTDIKYQEQKFEDQRNYQVKNDAFLNQGWIPSHTLPEGIVEMLGTIKERRIKDVNNPIYSNVRYLQDHYIPL